MTTPYEILANAVIVQAVYDYRAAKRVLWKHPGDSVAQATIDEIERFFRSEWYKSLTCVDGGEILRKLKEETYDCRGAAKQNRKHSSGIDSSANDNSIFFTSTHISIESTFMNLIGLRDVLLESFVKNCFKLSKFLKAVILSSDY